MGFGYFKDQAMSAKQAELSCYLQGELPVGYLRRPRQKMAQIFVAKPVQ